MRTDQHVRIGLAILLTSLAACGGARPERDLYVEPERDDPAALDRQQAERETELSELLLRPEVDCAAACPLGEAICDLSTRICEIARRHPLDTPLSRRCDDAAARCDRASERIAERCTCE